MGICQCISSQFPVYGLPKVQDTCLLLVNFYFLPDKILFSSLYSTYLTLINGSPVICSFGVNTGLLANFLLIQVFL
jgi:hypothetical protein